MNQKELYERAINRKESENKEFEETKSAYSEIAINQWLANEQTKEFQKWLKDEFDKAIVEAQNLALTGNNKNASRKLIRARTIQEILNYGRN